MGGKNKLINKWLLEEGWDHCLHRESAYGKVVLVLVDKLVDKIIIDYYTHHILRNKAPTTL